MHYKLLGFSQHGSVRRFLFQRATGMETLSKPFEVHADILLARRFNVMLQDLPSLCSRLLMGAGEKPLSGPHRLSETEISAYAEELSIAAAEVALAAASRSDRCRAALAKRSLAPADRTNDVAL